MTRLLGREVLSSITLRRAEIEIPEWNGTALIRELSAAEAARIKELLSGSVDTQKTLIKGEPMSEAIWQVCRMGWINEDGTPVLAADDRQALLAMGETSVDTLSGAILKLSGLSGANPVREAKKNLEANRNGASGSDLHSP